MISEVSGPFLTLDAVTGARQHLAALLVAPPDVAVSDLQIGSDSVPFVRLAQIGDTVVYRARFEAPANAASAYRWNDTTYTLAGHLTEDIRIAFASCNGEEKGDMDRDQKERNAMWARLCEEHRSAPFSLLLHGGDQIYADEATKGHALSDAWPRQIPKDPSRPDLDDLRQHLRLRFLERYVALMSDPDYAWLCARVPSLAQWDDHDICDGWGSLPRSRTYSPVGQTLFDVAREMALLFQHAAVDGDLPARFHDPQGRHLGWVVDTPGLRLLAPDLRSERTRRQIMGEGGWRFMEEIAAQAAPKRTVLISSVPLLGPRLSILETLLVALPAMQKYEDDLRDQWQSRAHRASWQRMLRLMCSISDTFDADVTVLSGEIHLATRATMKIGKTRIMHQLVASGIAHRPPPQKWARFLGALASFGASPLPRHPIKICAIPGQTQRYVAQRNALILTRKGDEWQAVWDFEHAGVSQPLTI